jgi:hypothetical protein
MENLSYINYKKLGKCEHVMKQNIYLASGHVKPNWQCSSAWCCYFTLICESCVHFWPIYRTGNKLLAEDTPHVPESLLGQP